ncbi:MAG TPA: exo-alpha-sialidase [Acidimicrobiia bacterium]|nr:exo-alpha-sialidase [Acidimicrobiia bacterium]
MTTIGIGTVKGAFFLRGNGSRWDLSGPQFKGWAVTTFGRSPSGDHLLATGSNWFGAAIHRSADLGEWEQIVDGPAWPEGGDRKLNNVWTIATSGDTTYAAVDQAGLFRSDDDGASWRPVPGFNEHATRPGWQPGFGGLAAHRLLFDPNDAERMWLGVSAVGVFRTEDGGDSWQLANKGVTKPAPDPDDEEIGYCVHCLVADPDDPDTIWRQEHTGVYRTHDGGDSWQRIEEGLPARFGFPIARDGASGALFVVPLESDEHRMPLGGEFRVYRSTDRGDSWHVSGEGHPEEPVYAGVLRDAIATDGAGGVYVGTTAGTVHLTGDGGDTWTALPEVLPRILSVGVLEV